MSEAHDQEFHFGRGATLMEQGAYGDFCYLILSGRVEVFRMEDDAKLRLAEMGEGGVVGEMALIDPAPRAASVVAIEPTVCRRINAAALDRALQAAPPLARYLLQTFIRNIRHADGIAPPAQGIRIGTGDPAPAAADADARHRARSALGALFRCQRQAARHDHHASTAGWRPDLVCRRPTGRDRRVAERRGADRGGEG